MFIDIKYFYLCAPMDKYEDMKMPILFPPKHIIQQNMIWEKKVGIW